MINYNYALLSATLLLSTLLSGAAYTATETQVSTLSPGNATEVGLASFGGNLASIGLEASGTGECFGLGLEGTLVIGELQPSLGGVQPTGIGIVQQYATTRGRIVRELEVSRNPQSATELVVAQLVGPENGPAHLELLVGTIRRFSDLSLEAPFDAAMFENQQWTPRDLPGASNGTFSTFGSIDLVWSGGVPTILLNGINERHNPSKWYILEVTPGASAPVARVVGRGASPRATVDQAGELWLVSREHDLESAAALHLSRRDSSGRWVSMPSVLDTMRTTLEFGVGIDQNFLYVFFWRIPVSSTVTGPIEGEPQLAVLRMDRASGAWREMQLPSMPGARRSKANYGATVQLLDANGTPSAGSTGLALCAKGAGAEHRVINLRSLTHTSVSVH